MFQDFDDLPFGFFALAACTKAHFYPVTVHGVCRVAFGDEDGFSSVIGRKRVLTVAFALEDTGQHLSFIVQFILSVFGFDEESVLSHFLQDIRAEHFQGVCSEFQPPEQLFQPEGLSCPQLEITDEQFGEFFFLHAFPAFFFFLLLSHSR